MISHKMTTTTMTMTMTNLTLALALASLGGCKDKPAGGEAGEPLEPAATTAAGEALTGDALAGDAGEAPPGAPASGVELDDPRAAALVIAASTSPSPIAGRGDKSLGNNIEKISHLFALAATAKLPDWGAAGEGEAKLSRDDDLDTAWQCDFGGAKPCVLGLALPEPAKVEVLRIYAAAGPRYRDYTGSPRVAKLRVHTQTGYVDATLADGANHTYVRFDAPVETQYLALEVLSVHGSKAKGPVHLAEVEVFGTDGVARQAIDLDPERAWASWETTTWGGTDKHTIRQVFVNVARPDQTRRRLLRATALFGQAGDPYLLFERMQGTDCIDHAGSYLLFDQRSRMYYPLFDLGGAGADVYRHTSGRGFAVGWISDGQFTVKGVVEEGGTLKWKRPPKTTPDDGEALLREWGFETEPRSRGLSLTSGEIPGCHRATAGELDPLVSVAKFKDAPTQTPAQWLVCSVGPDTIYASAACGAPAQAFHLSGDKLVGKHLGKQDDARGLRLRRVGDSLLLELSSAQGDSSTLLWAAPGELIELESNGGLSVRPPSACSACNDDWRNPERDDSDSDDDYDPSYADADDADAEPEPEPEPEDYDEPEPEDYDEDEARDTQAPEDEPEPRDDAPPPARPQSPPAPTPPLPG